MPGTHFVPKTSSPVYLTQLARNPGLHFKITESRGKTLLRTTAEQVCLDLFSHASTTNNFGQQKHLNQETKEMVSLITLARDV